MRQKLLFISSKAFKALVLFFSIICLSNLTVNAQEAGDYRSVTGSNQSFASTSTWETFDGSNWIPASSPPMSNQQFDITIVSGSDVIYTTTGDGFFRLNADLIIDGDFTVVVNTNSNSTFVARTDGFILNTGGRFIANFGNNPKLTVDIVKKFVINGGQLIYSSGGSNSAIFFDIHGDAFINGGLTLNESNNQSLNNSGLYMRGTAPQHLSVSSQVSALARERFFIKSGSTNEITVSYDGSIAQNTVFGANGILRENFTGLQDRTNNINFTVNNSSATGVTLSRGQTVSGTLQLLDGVLYKGSNALNMATGATIERTGGDLNAPITSYGTSVNLLYSSHTSAVTMAHEVPSTDIIDEFIIDNSQGVVANQDFKVNGLLSLNSGSLDLQNYALKVNNDIQKISGNINAGNALVDFTGDIVQNVAPGAFLNNTIKHLKNSGTGGPNLTSELNVTDLLEVSTGNLVSNGNLYLRSSSTKTAQVAQVGGAISGDVTVEQFYPAKRAFRLLTSSVTTSSSIRANWQENATAFNDNPKPGYGTHITGVQPDSNFAVIGQDGDNGFDYNPSGNYSMFTFDNLEREWSAVPNTNQILTAGTPYRLMIRGGRHTNIKDNGAAPSETRLRATGNLQTGSYSNSDLSQEAGNLSFIANPYHAQVNMNSVLSASSNLSTSEYYIWDPTLGGINGRGAYVAIDLSSGDAAIYNPEEPAVPSGSSSANQYLQPMQAAFVKTSTAGTATINFEESFKEVSPAQTTTKSVSDSEYLNIQLFDAQSFAEGNTASDGLKIKFNDSYSYSVKDDSPKLGNIDENLLRIEGSEGIAIERRPMPEGEERLELFINQYRREAYVMKFDVTDNLYTQLYLEDKYLDELIKITKTNNTYSFTVDGSVSESTATDRFSLVLNPVSLSTPEEELLALSLYPNPTAGKFSISGQDLAGGAEVQIYNMLGQQVYKRNIEGQSTVEVTDFNVNAGLYLVKVKTSQGERTFKLIKEGI